MVLADEGEHRAVPEALLSGSLRPRPAAASGASPMTIFVPHASDRLTDREAHGDGLIAYEIVSRLAGRGHRVFVASPRIELHGPVPPTLHLQAIDTQVRETFLTRLRYMREVRRYFERADAESGVDIIHQLNPVFTGISLALLDKARPVVLGSYVGYWPDETDSRQALGKIRFPAATLFRNALAGEQQRRASALCLSTPAAITRVVNRKRDAHKIELVPHGIDPSIYIDSALAGQPAGDPTIVYVGGIERRKGIADLVRAFEVVAPAIPQARLKIAGSGWYWGEIAALIERSQFQDRMTMLGNVERRDLPGLLKSATVVCVPSLGEPFGMTLLEAMASARPVVVSDAGGPRDMVDAAGGIRFPCGDVERLAKALIDVLGSPHQRAMGLHNREVVERRFAWDIVIDRLEAIYRALLVPAR